MWQVSESEKPGAAVFGVLSLHSTDGVQASGGNCPPGASGCLPTGREVAGHARFHPHTANNDGGGQRKLKS